MEGMKLGSRGSSLLFIASIIVFAQLPATAQSGTSLQSTPAGLTPGQKIVTKDPEYLKLLDPPKEAAYFQAYSKSYRDAFAEINSKFTDVTDVAARDQARKEEWEKVLKSDGDKFQYEADTAFRDAKIAYAQSHRDAWLVVGPVYYDTNNSVLRAKAFTNAPIVANVRVPLTPADLQKLYDRYHILFADEIDRRAHDYVAKAGAGSNCARIPDLCYKYSYQDIEDNMRANRIVAVAQGDFEAGRIDRLFIADYDTEMVVQDLGAAAGSEISGIAWRFAPGPAPVKPAEPAPPETQTASAQPGPSAPVQPSAEAPAAQTPPTAPPPAPDAQSDSAKPSAGSTDAAAPASDAASATTPAKPPAPPIVVPANVTAASIVTQTKPIYPPEARAKLVQGEVLLRAIIDKEGKISEVHVLSGDDLLAQAAVEAVKQWRYKPMLVDGEAREVDTTITVTFSMKN
jgi:periplasmic protein TonB